MTRRKKIGLACGSGGFRGFAHIGVIQELQAAGLKIDFISGSSIGALVAAYYALYQEVDSLPEKIISLGKDKFFNFLDMGLKSGLISSQKFNKVLQTIFQDLKFSDTKIPLFINTTNLINGQQKIIHNGNLVSAIQASCSVPLLFNPVKINNQLLVDGALNDPVPINVLRQAGAKQVIAVNLYHQNEFINKKFNLATTTLRSSRILLYHLAQTKTKEADFIINPDLSRPVLKISLKVKDFFSPAMAKQAINLGRQATRRALPQIKKLL